MALRLIPSSLRRSGFLVTVISVMRQHRRQLRASVEALRPHGFVVRFHLRSSCAAKASTASLGPTFVTIAKRPSWRAGDARRSASDLPVVTSENVCGQLARRANQSGRMKCCQARSSRVPDAIQRVTLLRRSGTYAVTRIKDRGPRISSAPQARCAASGARRPIKSDPTCGSVSHATSKAPPSRVPRPER